MALNMLKLSNERSRKVYMHIRLIYILVIIQVSFIIIIKTESYNRKINIKRLENYLLKTLYVIVRETTLIKI